MSVCIEEVRPGAWRWVFRDAMERIVACSMLFSSPQACWLSLAQLNGASATVH